jgi:hypothetical protein
MEVEPAARHASPDGLACLARRGDHVQLSLEETRRADDERARSHSSRAMRGPRWRIPAGRPLRFPSVLLQPLGHLSVFGIMHLAGVRNLTELSKRPGLCRLPIPIHGLLRHVQHLRGFLHSEATEKPQLHDLTHSGIERCERRYPFAERNEITRGLRNLRHATARRHGRPIADPAGDALPGGRGSSETRWLPRAK